LADYIFGAIEALILYFCVRYHSRLACCYCYRGSDCRTVKDEINLAPYVSI